MCILYNDIKLRVIIVSIIQTHRNGYRTYYIREACMDASS